MPLLADLRESNALLALLISLTAFFLLRAVAASKSSRINAPILGSTALFGYVTMFKAFMNMRQTLEEGYYKYNSRPFQLPSLRGWETYVAGKYVDEMRRAPDDTLSFQEEVTEILASHYTLGPAIADNPWHVSIVRKQLTHNLAAVFPGVYDEIATAFAEEPIGTEWTRIKANELVVRIVCRASNRLFVGVPLCRNKKYLAISTSFTFTVVAGAFVINLFPTFLRPVVGRFLTGVPAALREFQSFMLPLIEERHAQAAEYGDDWADKPNDLLQWFIDSAEGEEREPKAITLRMLTMNFAAIHTSSMSFTHVLYYLAANPQHAAPLREEVERIVAEQGWTKDALNSMHKVDSFVKESQRLRGIGIVSMGRRVLKPFTFSDGTRLPAGAHVAANSFGVHHDPAIYAEPETFEPFRFFASAERGDVKAPFTSASAEYLPWGYGAHACPGRYFASQELKAMLAHIVLHYDVCMPPGQEGVRPADRWFGNAVVPDTKAEVMFRRRA